MKSNGLLKWLTIPIVLLVVFVGIRLLSEPLSTSPSTVSGSDALTAEEMKTLGIEGDTPQDTIATLVGEVKQLRSELKGALDENKQHKADNERLRLRDSAIDQRIETAIVSERERLQQERDQTANQQQQTQSLLEDLQRRLDAVSNKTGSSDVPVGLGLEAGDAPQQIESASFDRTSVHWIEPQDVLATEARSVRRRSASDRGMQFPTSFAPGAEDDESGLSSAAEAIASASENAPALSSVKQTYTVPADATLVGSIAMTALIGRVPIDGVVADPYPFKVIIGPDNLTANGIELPNLAGAVASGTAAGDWTLSCVRGQIRSLTFVFTDGTIRTVRSSAGGSGDSARNTQAGLGWISDPHGVPCVSGKRLSNAQQYFSSQMLITAAGAGAASLIDSENGNFSFINGNGTSLGTVRISGNEAMERILASGVQEMSQWASKLYGQAFAAVYVAPTAKVAVHIEQELAIDHDANGRKVNHLEKAISAPDLD